MNLKKLHEFETIFHPKSIAVVGASSKRAKDGTLFLKNLLRSGFKGKIYSVNSAEGEILGTKSYPKVADIPDPVDYVIVSVPARSVLEVLDDCAAKGVKAVHIFSAGFKEAGTAEGRWLEEEIAKKANGGGFRVIGPNCMGIYNSAINCSYWGVTGKAGSVAVIGQSGGITVRAIIDALARGVQFSKAVSFGNGCDLDGTDFLEYFATDPDTKIIGIYMEGVRDGRRFFGLLREVSKTKPVVMWKGGRTEAGAEVTMSHTGSLTTSNHVWEALAKQAGLARAESIEEIADALIAFWYLGEFRGRSAGIVCGLSRGGGGDSVSATDACSSLGIEVPSFSAETRRDLATILPWAGTILRNALDVSMLGSMDVLERTLAAVAADSGIDMVIIQERIPELMAMMPVESVQAINDVIIQLKRSQPKPVVVVSTPGLPTTLEQWEVEKKLVAAQLPVYPSMERAARAIAMVSQYFNYREAISSNG